MVTSALEGLGGLSDEEPRRGGVVRRIAIVLAIAFLLLVLALEAASRIADRVTAGTPPAPISTGILDKIAMKTLDPSRQMYENARTIPHPYLSFDLRPSFRTPSGAAQQCSHNALGFRGKETTWEKPPGVFRIVTLGGSSVYGQSESCDDAVWSARLAKILAEERPGARIEVINGGVSGYTSYEMLIELELKVMD